MQQMLEKQTEYTLFYTQITRVLTKVSEGLFWGTVFLSCWQAVGELSASQRHNWQTVVFNVVMVRVSFGERERESEREIKK